MSPSRSYAGECAEERVARRRRQLLDAGLELFGTIGYQRTTVRALCRVARVADRNFYEEFASTDDLLLAVYEECHERLQQAVLAAAGGREEEAGAERLAHDGLDAFLALVESDPRLARVIWFESLGVSPRIEAAHAARTTAFAELLAALLSPHELPAGEPPEPPEQPDVVMLAVVGGVSQVVLNWVSCGFSPPRAQLIEPLVSFLLSSAGLSRRYA